MKKFLLATVAVMALSVSACAPQGYSYTLPEIASTAAAGQKALYGAEASFYAANTTASTLASGGLLRGSDAIKVADALAISYASLNLARAALKAGDATAFERELAKSQTMTAAAVSLLPERKP